VIYSHPGKTQKGTTPNPPQFRLRFIEKMGSECGKYRITDPFFRDLEYSAVLAENGFIKWLKNCPNRPFWEANLRFNRWGVAGKRKPLFDPLNGRPGQFIFTSEKWCFGTEISPLAL
jgi:hypothetical protein